MALAILPAILQKSNYISGGATCTSIAIFSFDQKLTLLPNRWLKIYPLQTTFQLLDQCFEVKRY